MDEIFQFSDSDICEPLVEGFTCKETNSKQLDVTNGNGSLKKSLNTSHAAELFSVDESQTPCEAPLETSISCFREQPVESLLETLSEHLISLRELIEVWFYVTNLNHTKLRYWKYEHDVFLEYRESQLIHEKRQQYMSLFVDEYGRPAPSTEDALLKAEGKQQLPIFRKKYDWNVHIWNHQLQQRLLELTATRVTTDILKLKVEELLASHEIQEYEIIEQLVQLRRALGFESTPCNKRLAEALDLLQELLNHKAQRMLSQGIPEGKELLNIPIQPDYKASLNDELSEKTWFEKITRNYWTGVFDEIASMLGSRFECSGRDCQIQWLHHLSPTVNRKAMTQEEDKKLCELACLYNKRHWDKIATDLNTQRTAYQCFERYQRQMNQSLEKTEWTPEEDAYLTAIVENMGHEISGPCKWKQVALNFPGRSNLQCRARYLYTLRSNLKQGNWTRDEDILLQLLIHAYGGYRWSKIAQHFPHRTDMKCRERYEGVLNPAIQEITKKQFNVQNHFNNNTSLNIQRRNVMPFSKEANHSSINNTSLSCALNWLLMTAAEPQTSNPPRTTVASTDLLRQFYYNLRFILKDNTYDANSCTDPNCITTLYSQYVAKQISQDVEQLSLTCPSLAETHYNNCCKFLLITKLCLESLVKKWIPHSITEDFQTLISLIRRLFNQTPLILYDIMWIGTGFISTRLSKGKTQSDRSH